MTIRVCHLILSLDRGGMENGIVNVSNRIGEFGIETHVLCIRRLGELAARLANQGDGDFLQKGTKVTEGEPGWSKGRSGEFCKRQSPPGMDTVPPGSGGMADRAPAGSESATPSRPSLPSVQSSSSSSVHVKSLDYSTGFHLSGVWRIARYLRRNRIDILYTHNRSALIWGGLAQLLCPTTKLIHGEHGFATGVKRENRLCRRLIRLTDLVTAVSDNLVAETREAYGCPELDVEVIPNGVDTQKFRIAHERHERARTGGGYRGMGVSGCRGNGVSGDGSIEVSERGESSGPAPPRSPLRAELGLSRETVLFACVGRLEPRKNQQLAIRALAASGSRSAERGARSQGGDLPDGDLTGHCVTASLRQKGPPPMALVLIGDGPDREKLEGLATSLGLVIEAGRRSPPTSNVVRERDLSSPKLHRGAVPCRRLGGLREMDSGDRCADASRRCSSSGRATSRLAGDTGRSPSDVFFLGFRDDVADLLPQINVLLLPSAWGEGMANVILEANACGVPVLASDIPGNDQLIRDGINGFLLPVQSPPEPDPLRSRTSDAQGAASADANDMEVGGPPPRSWSLAPGYQSTKHEARAGENTAAALAARERIELEDQLPPGAACVQRWAEAMIDLAGDREKRQELGETARNLVVAEYSLDCMVRRYVDLYRQICPIRPTSRT